jgi:hypothetical protein
VWPRRHNRFRATFAATSFDIMKTSFKPVRVPQAHVLFQLSSPSVSSARSLWITDTAQSPIFNLLPSLVENRVHDHRTAPVLLCDQIRHVRYTRCSSQSSSLIFTFRFKNFLRIHFVFFFSELLDINTASKEITSAVVCVITLHVFLGYFLIGAFKEDDKMKPTEKID